MTSKRARFGNSPRNLTFASRDSPEQDSYRPRRRGHTVRARRLLRLVNGSPVLDNCHLQARHAPNELLGISTAQRGQRASRHFDTVTRRRHGQRRQWNGLVWLGDTPRPTITLRLAAETVNGQVPSVSQFFVDRLTFCSPRTPSRRCLSTRRTRHQCPHSVMRVKDVVVVASPSWRPTSPHARERVTMWPT